MRRKNRQKGFTLIEVIAVLLIVGILAAFAGLGIVSAVQGYLLAKDTAAISEKAQLALARINRELLECYNCFGGGGTDDVVMPIYNTLGNRCIVLNTADNIVISPTDSGGACPSAPTDDILLDSVKANSFRMQYNSDGSISVRFIVNHPGGTELTFTSRVDPRNT